MFRFRGIFCVCFLWDSPVSFPHSPAIVVGSNIKKL